jgi:hypothetical protein
MKYPAKFWTSLLRKVEQYLPVRFDYTPSSARQHPWQLSPYWYKNGDKSEWRATVLPGLVNGLPAYISMPFKEAPPSAQARIEKENSEKNLDTDKNALINVYLDEDAKISLNRFVDISSSAPDFFKRLGATDPVANRAGDLESTATRLLKSCDIVLTQPRPSLTNRVDYGLFGSGVQITSAPGLFVPRNREPFLISTSRFVEKKEPPSFRSVFFNTFVDTGRDEVHLSRFYLLSPTLPLLDPDDLSIWQPYVEYKCHYNLVHATQQIPKAKSNYEKPLTIQTGLLGGLADSIFNNLLTGGLNVANDVLSYLNQRDLSGKFYIV